MRRDERRAFNLLADLHNFLMRAGRRLLSKYYTSKVRLIAASVGRDLRVNAKTKVTRNTHIGDNCNFNGMVIEGGGTVTIGDYFHSGRDILFITQNHDFDRGESIPYGRTYITGDITIGPFVWIGHRVIVLGGVTIGEGAVIQAGSVVASDIPPCAVAGGHPATVFKYRDVGHFNRLKEEGRFH
jgi:acetyltransferase-like isoleucine patch superfamily enzyme